MPPDTASYLAPSYLAPLVLGSEVVVGLVVIGGFLMARARLGGADRAAGRAAVLASAGLIAWFVLALWLSRVGVFRATADGPIVPAIAFGLAVPLTVGLIFVLCSGAFGRLLATVPQHWLIALQVYRSFGILFLILHGAGRLPGAFALPAGYGDLLVGISAPMVAYLYLRRHHREAGGAHGAVLPGAVSAWAGSAWAVLAWNVVGIADLVVAVSLGLLSAPGPLQILALSAPNEAITVYPLVMVPVFAVPLSILLHAASLRKLAAATATATRPGAAALPVRPGP